jgi:hypothetical protein
MANRIEKGIDADTKITEILHQEAVDLKAIDDEEDILKKKNLKDSKTVVSFWSLYY